MLRITLNDKDNAAKTLSSLPQRLRAAILSAMRESAVLLQSLAKLNAPVFRGLLRLSIAQSVTDEGDKITAEVGSGLVYASVIEEGRKVGWFPPPSGDLKTWARRKLGDERLAYVVARAIKRRGFRAQPYMKPALGAAVSRIQLIFQNRVTEAVKAGGGA